MTKRIFRAIMVVATCVLLACILCFMAFLYSHFSNIQEQQLDEALTFAVQGVEQTGGEYLDSLGSQRYRLTWVAPDGAVLYDSQTDPAVMDSHADREEIREAMTLGQASSSRYSSTLLEETLYRAKRLSDGSVLRISVSRATAWILTLGMIQPIILVVLLALVLAFILASKTSKQIVEPLDKLDLDEPLENDVYEELSPLLRRIDSQNRRIEAQMAELERKHTEAERLRKEFTANVSHELKTPLQTISGSVELMRNGLVLPADQPEFLERIDRESQRLITLVDDILRLSKLDEGADLAVEDVDLTQLTKATLQRLEPAAEQAQVALELRGAGGTLSANRRLLEEVLYNLVENAVKYNRPGGSVTVTLSTAGFTVSDTGIGIPPELQSRVFERFYRVDPSRSNTVGGTGLGLSIVKHGVAALGGELQLTSAPGAGTTVTVTLPEN